MGSFSRRERERERERIREDTPLIKEDYIRAFDHRTVREE